ncbi:DUF397 domain-containing protein [Streptomyces flavalbus]|uniref:DUF397 domain-containing protein n=1 Tax=Streptomyces flavalbus TaxID=2665155 RepID=A0ABW2WCE2_9ACTN
MPRNSHPPPTPSTPTTLHLRDSKSPDRTLTLTPATWTAFLRALPEMLA